MGSKFLGFGLHRALDFRFGLSNFGFEPLGPGVEANITVIFRIEPAGFGANQAGTSSGFWLI